MAAPAAELLRANAAPGPAPEPAPAVQADADESISIRAYLAREARRITARAPAGCTDLATWKRLLPERRRQYMEMMGLDELPPPGRRSPLNTKITGVLERGRYRIEKLYFESVPNLFVTANLYIPKSLAAPAPAILYLCGHSEKQKVYYQAHPRHFAELGFVCLLIETLEAWEMEGYHHGPYEEGWFHWYSRGYTTAGVEALNGIRGLDLLAGRPEVDPQRLGVTGNSGGGTSTWWVAAADERVRACAPVCGTSTLGSYVRDRSIDANCDCMWWINSYLWDLADVGALIAPRPLLIADADRDEHFLLTSMRELYRQLERPYAMWGVRDHLARVEGSGVHGYHPVSRKAVFAWFVKHLQGKNGSPQEVGDIDERPEVQESAETLRVYPNGPPAGSRVRTIQDSFIRLAQPPAIESVADLQNVRKSVIAGLRRKSFGAFPDPAPPPRLAIEHDFQTARASGVVFRFTAEEGLRLRGVLQMSGSTATPAPVVVGLRSPREAFMRRDWLGGAMEEYLRRIPEPWARATVEVRGAGDGVWGSAIEWHLRRASAWTGRTLASMWVYDALRALACVRELPQVDRRHVALAAGGEMAAVALYAALLDGNVETLILQDAPATQNVASPRDGCGGALEMLGCLRVTDLPQVAGLLYPAELVFAGACPSTYEWAEALYRGLGAPERFRRIASIKEWRPAQG